MTSSVIFIFLIPTLIIPISKTKLLIAEIFFCVLYIFKLLEYVESKLFDQNEETTIKNENKNKLI